jgi:predicted AlkP superfamily pyrophosphatase or phosphodiesterase
VGDGADMQKLAILNVVGLTADMLGPAMPTITEWAHRKSIAVIQPPLPAVTCTSQATFWTGAMPDQHGIVGNGWYFRDECDVRFWRQSNRLVDAPKIWELARQRDPAFTCANIFGWYNMYSSVDYSITPRPMYPADGRKLPDVYTEPPEIRAAVQRKLGTFPLFEFWGPRTSINSTRWIAESAKYVDERYRPTLTLVYLPHLDYNLQRLGPDDPAIATDLREIDEVCGDLIRYYERSDTEVILLSEYGIVPVNTPIHINRVLREHGLIRVREELGLEILDPGASAAFAIADHQIAHVYINDKSKADLVRRVVENIPGVDDVLDTAGKQRMRIDHSRSGELVAIAKSNAWFTYYYWIDDARAPDFARTVDIHRKPGYDPVELFVDPTIRAPFAKIGYTLLKRKLGFRDLLSVIPLDATLVKGSHGRVNTPDGKQPVFISSIKAPASNPIAADAICEILLRHLFSETYS